MDLNGHKITWLGHATFLIETPAGKKLLIDPWLKGNPACPEEFRKVETDGILITHGHSDHIGDVSSAAKRCSGKVGCIVEIQDYFVGEGLDEEKFVGFNKGGTVRLEEVGACATMTDAQHSSSSVDKKGKITYLGAPAGYVIRFDDGPTIYVAGDTGIFGDMALIGELYRPGLAILPIGDHYTMGPFQAAHACRLLGIPSVIPSHFGTFPVLTGTPDQLRSELATLGLSTEVIALESGGSTP